MVRPRRGDCHDIPPRCRHPRLCRAEIKLEPVSNPARINLFPPASPPPAARPGVSPDAAPQGVNAAWAGGRFPRWQGAGQQPSEDHHGDEEEGRRQALLMRPASFDWTAEDVQFAQQRRRAHIAWREEIAKAGGPRDEIKRLQRAEKAVTLCLQERESGGVSVPAELAGVVAHEAACVRYRLGLETP